MVTETMQQFTVIVWLLVSWTGRVSAWWWSTGGGYTHTPDSTEQAALAHQLNIFQNISYFHDGCKIFANDFKAKTAAESACQLINSTLASLHEVQKYEAVRTWMYDDLQVDSSQYILTSGSFENKIWTWGSSGDIIADDDTRWRSTGGGTTNKNCLALGPDGFHAVDCESLNMFVCDQGCTWNEWTACNGTRCNREAGIKTRTAQQCGCLDVETAPCYTPCNQEKFERMDGLCYPTSITEARSSTECASMCLNKDGCVEASYSRKHSKCYLTEPTTEEFKLPTQNTCWKRMQP